ncbi:MAG: amidohydrolase family protein [Edaphobacter sp.]|uniref:amidohydrolase family protein n=1 Tax=Edaphobacter sp. TaxID=1934404 RepID=UPI0023A4DD4C|nr:amidohydrolase family protein [Edaphobacter sp.]MDE1177797.1 amidohydrolase family protein [Edaphobacter sp.]
MSRSIDAHHHLWRYTEEEYGWIDGTMSSLRQDFLPADLMAVMREAGIDGAVAVQARQTMEETRWLLGLAEICDEILGVVGWAPLASPQFAEGMEALAGRKKLRGLRHIVQGEPDGFMRGAAFNAGIAQLDSLGLTYDVLIYERQLKEATEFVDRHPQQRFVVDHIAKPKIREGVVQPWADEMRELARRENVWCKVSGMVTEADWSAWTPATLRPYLDVVTEAFGPRRLMAGSDWPVCLVASGYGRWFSILRDYFSAWSEQERDAIFGGTAIEFYRL